jgi:hypothetical protein
LLGRRPEPRKLPSMGFRVRAFLSWGAGDLYGRRVFVAEDDEGLVSWVTQQEVVRAKQRGESLRCLRDNQARVQKHAESRV